MSTTGRQPSAPRVEVVLPRPTKPEFKRLGGSDSDHFNQTLANQALATLWTANSDEEQRNRQYLAATAALIGAKPHPDEAASRIISPQKPAIWRIPAQARRAGTVGLSPVECRLPGRVPTARRSDDVHLWCAL